MFVLVLAVFAEHSEDSTEPKNFWVLTNYLSVCNIMSAFPEMAKKFHYTKNIREIEREEEWTCVVRSGMHFHLASFSSYLAIIYMWA